MDEKDIPMEVVPRRRRRPAYKTDTSKLRYISGKQKWFAKNYKATPYDDPSRVGMRTYIGNNYRSASATGKMIRNALQYYGPGDYRSTLSKWIPKGTFANAGRFIGNRLGVPGAGDVGSWAGSKFANYVGFGDYNTMNGGVGSVNQLAGGHPPITVNSSGDMTGDVIMTRTEFVGNITVSTGAATITPFQINTYQINPGLSGTFPWLSQIASNFELYDWEGLMFMYRPTSGEFGASAVSNALGKVVMATKYGVTQFNPFSSTVEAQNYDYANSTKPSMSMVHGVETKNTQQVGGDMLVIRDADVPNEANVVLYDLGRLYVMTEGIPLAANTTAIIGELWVTYKVRLSRAKLWASLNDGLSYARLEWGSSAGALVASFVKSRTEAQWIPTLTNVSATECKITINNDTPTFLTQTFQVQFYSWDDTAVQSRSRYNDPSSLVNCTVVTSGMRIAGTTSCWRAPDADPAAGSTNRAFSTSFWLRVTNPSLPFSFNQSINAPAVVNALFNEVLIMGVDNDMVTAL